MTNTVLSLSNCVLSLYSQTDRTVGVAAPPTLGNSQLCANRRSITQTRLSHLLFSFCINIIDHVPQHLFTGSGLVQSAADVHLMITCRQFESLGLSNLLTRCLPSVPFWRVPEQVAADLSSIWDHGGVVKKRLVSNLHLEKPLVSGGQLLGQRPQRQQRQQRHTPTFIVPHPVKTEDERFSRDSLVLDVQDCRISSISAVD